MKFAAVTFVFNETINLPIWIKYYGSNFGEKNLFVVDHGSTDGSTSDLGDVNRIVIPREVFDDRQKADFLSAMQNALVNYYDAVICGDCDELVVPYIGTYENLAEYVARMESDYVSCIGLNVLHILNEELPLDVSRPILAQRRYARFWSATSKTMLSRVPIKWMPGLHCLNRRPKFDPNLFMFHTKTMDYGVASGRHAVNRELPWSEDSLLKNHGVHHRSEYAQFIGESFFVPINIVSNGKVQSFDFTEELAKIEAEIAEKDGFYRMPMGVTRWVEIPEILRTAF